MCTTLIASSFTASDSCPIFSSSCVFIRPLLNCSIQAYMLCFDQGWHLTYRVILCCRVTYLHIENVDNFQKKPQKPEKSKNVIFYPLENEFYTFSKLDVSSNEFLVCQLATLTTCQHQFTLDAANCGCDIIFYSPYATTTCWWISLAVLFLEVKNLIIVWISQLPKLTKNLDLSNVLASMIKTFELVF